MPQHAILLDDQAYYVRYEGDPNGRGYWAIVDPNNPHGFSGTLAVRLNEFNEWERVPGAKGLKGGGGNSSKAAKKTPPSPTPPPSQPVAQSPSDVHRVTTPFDTPPSTRPEVKRWAMGLNETHVQSRFGRIDRFTHYYGATHRKLLQLAQDFYNELPWTRLPARPNIPAFEPTATLDEALEHLPDEIPGYVIGETLDRVASTRLVIEKMPLFARKGVKTLYMRRLLNDFAQDDLNLYFRTGVMSEDLENHLSHLGTDPSGQFNELELVKVARDNGIRVQAIDCAAHYKYPDPAADLSEQVTSNYLAHTLIQTDRALNGGGKWLVLTGVRNINTFNGFAGLSELEGGIGLRVEEVLPGQGNDVRLDPGVAMDRDNAPLLESTGDSFDTFHADLRVQVEAPLVRRTVQQNHRLLFRKGMYLIDESQGNYTLLHHSRDRGIVSTPINRPADGSFYIDRPGWATIHNVHFPTLEKLSSALTNMGMSLQSRLPI
ncbi:membrane-targeted effector domain-containing toxin [Pseudomonas sp. R2-37-08W]|uniref:membrane-targeted effector domain-containing toxin n=1 Tax=Pseudomonas sp. R2-37-08W TaxID=1173273 RepID=UPI000F5882E5|nr:membrane-targeted effector domain-containing toxin [Pseudomonas sp. R2-37-08W]